MCENDQEELLIFIKKIINDLKSNELFQRKSALVDLKKKLFPESNKLSQSTLHAAFEECQMHILKGFRDKSEINRDLFIQIMKEFIEELVLNDYYLTYIFPVLVERVGSVEIIEESEEIRLELVKFLRVIINRYTKQACLVPFLNDIVRILSQTVVDGYPKLKEESCNCIMDSAKAMPLNFHMQCENLVKPVLKNFGHQHYRIRVIAIKTLGVIILHSTGATIIETTITPFAERLFDQNPAVRKEIGYVIGQLLLEYRDRYSNFHKFIPLILTLLSDEIPEIRQEIGELWSKVGQQYENENKEDLRNQIDFPIKAPDNYPPVQRPNLGCRTLVQRNATKIYKALSMELSSWQEDIRVRCAQLLCVIVLHCEQNVTQGLQEFLPAMYTACEYQRDEQKAVLENIMHAAKYIGIFVPVKHWSELVIPVTSDSPTCGHIRILRSIAAGTPLDDLKQIAVELADLLATKEVRCGNRKPVYQKELVKFCETLLPCEQVTTQLFVILITVVALSASVKGRGAGDAETVAEQARELLWKITEPVKHIKFLLEELASIDASFGESVYTERCIFDTLLCEWTTSLFPNLGLVGMILMRSLDEQCDAQARLSTFESLSKFLKHSELPNAVNEEEHTGVMSLYMEKLITDILLPSLVWRSGRSAEALRTAASFCLVEALRLAGDRLKFSDEYFQNTLKNLITLTDDTSPRTRLYGSRSLTRIKTCLSDEMLTKWANETAVNFVKRLDDPNETVRNETMICLKEVVDVPNQLTAQNLKFVIDGVLTHVDDEHMDPEVALVGK